MSSLVRALFAILLLVRCAAAAAEPSVDCDREGITAHARLQFEIYGPLSINAEYFGFIFRDGEEFRSVVVRSRKCSAGNCVIHVDEAGKLIPKGVRVLGEWHTHPHDGAPQLSEYDVRGAYRNRHVRCYIALYSTPDGQIYAWNPAQTSVPTAMASRARVGVYGSDNPDMPVFSRVAIAGQRQRHLTTRSDPSGRDGRGCTAQC